MRTAARWAVLLILCLASANAAAVDVLFRGDSREPDIIFRDGFQPLGTNRNVLAHVSGESCFAGEGADRSAYIATTQNEQDARRYGPSAYVHRSYVYRIVPDANAGEGTATFDARAGLLDLDSRRNALGLDLRVTAAIERLVPFHATQGQHFSERIPREWIASVDIYQRNPATGRMEFADNQLNPHYVRPFRVGSRTEFTPAMIGALAPINMIYLGGSDANATTTCMTACSTSSSRSLTAVDQCEAVDVYVPGNIFQRVLDIILD